MKLVTFDFWNTLFLDRDEGLRHTKRILFAHETIRKHRSSVGVEHIEAAFAEGHELFSRQWDLRQAVSMKHHFDRMLEHLEIALPEEDSQKVVEYFETILLEHPPAVIENAYNALQHAASKTSVGLISDTGYSPGTTLVRILEDNKMLDYFRAFSFSNETGVLKPSPLAFEKILQELKVDPSDAVHIGDLEETDIQGAKAIGMKAIKYIGSNPTAVRESEADFVIENMSELPAVLSVL